jgi:hypothetical protein
MSSTNKREVNAGVKLFYAAHHPVIVGAKGWHGKHWIPLIASENPVFDIFRGKTHPTDVISRLSKNPWSAHHRTADLIVDNCIDNENVVNINPESESR